MSKTRTFVAIDLGHALKHEAASVIEEFSQVAPSVRWVQPENLHLTLKFLGELTDPDLYAVCRTVDQCAANCRAFRLSCRQVGAFPSLDRARTVWLGVQDPKGQLTKFHAELEDGLSELGFPREPREFRPHVTIGRVPQRSRRLDGFASCLQSREHQDFGVIEVEQCVVYSSELTREGPIYSVLGRSRLAD